MDVLSLVIDYKGKEIELPVKAYPFGYTYRIEVIVMENVIIFEPDEEGDFRALGSQQIDNGLLEAIARQLLQNK